MYFQKKVTPAKSQSPCGACWAFSAIGMLESMVAIQKDVPIQKLDLSEQELQECAHTKGATNCSRGYMPAESISRIKNEYDGKLFGEKLYPWTAQKNMKHLENCKVNKMKDTSVKARITKVLELIDRTENGLKTVVGKIGPVSVLMNFTDAFSAWGDDKKSGVFSEENCITRDAYDHAVVVVGYGTDDDGEDYWIVKNSWGQDWGTNGFSKIARKMTTICGMADYALTAEVK